MPYKINELIKYCIENQHFLDKLQRNVAYLIREETY